MMRIKKNDTVTIISGKDRDKRGTVLEVVPRENKVKVKGLNMAVHHVKAKRKGEASMMKKQESYLSISKIMPICSSCNKACRVNFIIAQGNKTRVCNRCKQAL
ncbi:MAG: 50S ribosomal protein L24 [Candidatus Babeliaceae bacterium]